MAAPVARSVESEPLRATEGPQKGSGKSLPRALNKVAQTPQNIGGKSLVANDGKLVANPEVGLVANKKLPPTDDVADLFAKVREIEKLGQQRDTVAKGWRIEPSGNYWRWRWQLKDELGNSITYKMKSGKTGYKRGSKYYGKEKPSVR